MRPRKHVDALLLGLQRGEDRQALAPDLRALLLQRGMPARVARLPLRAPDVAGLASQRDIVLGPVLALRGAGEASRGAHVRHVQHLRKGEACVGVQRAGAQRMAVQIELGEGTGTSSWFQGRRQHFWQAGGSS